MYAGQSQQNDDGAAFSNCCMYRGDSNYVEVAASQGKRKIYFKNMIALSEFRNLGGWVHEFGHSLYVEYPNPSGGYRITDRYNYAIAVIPKKQYGTCNMWDVMGSGSHWGADDGGTPVQMSSFTKFVCRRRWATATDSAGQLINHTAGEDMKQATSACPAHKQVRISGSPDDYMIIEARDSGASYGAPATGIELRRVLGLEHNHRVVNALKPSPARRK